MTRRCALSCGSSLWTVRGGGIVARIITCASWAGRWNRKRVQRIWREEGLRVPQRKRKRRRLGESTVLAERLRAERPNQVWAFDFLVRPDG